MFGPEPEFFVFDHVRFNICDGETAVEIDGEEAPWNNGERRGSDALPLNRNLGGRVQKKQMYFPVGRIDTMMDLRSEMLLTMRDVGVPIEKHHHEAGVRQGELGFTCGELVEAADNVMAYKYVVKNVANLHNKTATFMPKPIYGDNGSGFHVHQSIWGGGTNLFDDRGGSSSMNNNISTLGMHYIAGILKHAWALLAITNPTTNSYKRLVPGYAAPCSLVYATGNRSAAIRIPITDSQNPKAKRLECRFPDGSCCPYLAFSALLLAGVDGIIQKMEPPPPFEKNVFQLSEEDKKLVPSTPSSLGEALDALEQDHEFLLRNAVFTEDFIQSFIALKRAEIRTVELVPHPKEFELYYNI